MALIKTDDKHYYQIAHCIRGHLGLFEDDETYLPEEMPDKIDEVSDSSFNIGYEQGYEQGHLDGWEAAKAEGDYDEGWLDGYETGFADAEEQMFEPIFAQGKAEGLVEGIEQGRVEGRAEGIEQGKTDERTTFWNVLQNNGGTGNFYYAFAYGKYTDANFNPVHPIRCMNGSTPGNAMFYNSPGITDTKVEIYANSNNINQAFNLASGLVTIRKIHVHETTKYDYTFSGATALVNIEFEGVIGQNIDFSSCSKLSKASITNVMTHLSTRANLTASFYKGAVNKAFATSTGANDGSTSAEWTALKAAVPNATIALV